MKVNDRRNERETKVCFNELKIGQVYEDQDSVLCIKTNNTNSGSNCIFLSTVGEWEACYEELSTKVFPLVTTLEIKGHEQ